MNIRRSVLLSAVIACAAATAFAATSSSTNHAAEHAEHWHRGEGMRNMPFMQALHQLDLTAQQRATIKGYVNTSRQANTTASRPDLTVIANPGDPGYATAINAAKDAAATRIQKASDLDVKIYGVLTSAQQAKLPQVLADMKTNAQQRRKDGPAHRQPATTG